MTGTVRLLTRTAVCAAVLLGGAVAAPAALAATPGGSYADTCQGWGGVANNLVSGLDGGMVPPAVGEPELDTPYLDGDTVRGGGTVTFTSWGSCSAQVVFQMQTKVCGMWGCNWRTANHGDWEFFWAHDDTGEVHQDVAMHCRSGTNSYRVHMETLGFRSDAEEGDPGALGVEPETDQVDGPAVKLTCP